MTKYKAIQQAVEQANKELDLWTKALEIHSQRPGMAEIVKKARQAPQRVEADKKQGVAA